MPSSTDLLWQHLYNCLDHQLESPAPKVYDGLAVKLAFLIRASDGFDVDPAWVSLPIIDVYNDANQKVGRKATLVLYKAPGNIEILLRAEVGINGCIASALQEKVDKASDVMLKSLAKSASPKYQQGQGGRK